MMRELNQGRRRFLGQAVKAIAGCQLGAVICKGSPYFNNGDAPAFQGASAWLNSPQLTKADLSGKVVVVDFWTYSCINWRRTLPYIRAWAKKYKENGLLLIGVHTPEFEFEKDIQNVRQAAKTMNIDYPIVIDSNHSIWRAFNNEYWPALYFSDAKGRVRASKFGEGDYQQSERLIQQLLAQAGATRFNRELVTPEALGAEAAADWENLRSSENYLGYERTQNFASAGPLPSRKCHTYTCPDKLKLNHWALSGGWTAEKQVIALSSSKGRIACQFHARDLNLVMGSATQGTSVRFRALIDGQSPGAAHGVDTDENGVGLVSEPRMYQLIRQQDPIRDRRFEVEFLDPGANAFSFTFG